MINTAGAPYQPIVSQLPESSVTAGDTVLDGTNTPPTRGKVPSEPNYIPELRPMDCYNRNEKIAFPCDPSSYITPKSVWVKYYASQLYISHDGRLKYIDSQEVVASELDGTKAYDDKLFLNNYISDNEQFHYPSNADMWVMPDYYLAKGQRDDCDGWAVTVTSILLSGEVSVKTDSGLVKQVIPARMVMGFNGKSPDGWVRYEVYGNEYITTTGGFITPDGSYASSTLYIQKGGYQQQAMFEEFKPFFEFDDKQFMKVDG